MVIIGTLAVTAVASLAKDRHDRRRAEAPLIGGIAGAAEAFEHG